MDYFFNKLYIIQSLRPDDMRTGELLFDNLHDNGEAHEMFDIEIQILKIRRFDKYFEILRYEIAAEEIMPLIQLEMHGDETGIQLSSHEIMYWTELIEYFKDFNIISRNNLIVSLALCNGGYILSALEHHITQEHPLLH